MGVDRGIGVGCACDWCVRFCGREWVVFVGVVDDYGCERGEGGCERGGGEHW